MVAVIVPCYNEASRLQLKVFENFIFENKEFHFYFVNDGSTDSTFSLLNSFVAANPQSTLINIEKNIGKGNAISHAVQQINWINYTFLAFIDADLEIPLNQLNKIFIAVNQQYSTLAALSVRNSVETNSKSMVRGLGSATIKFISARILGFSQPITDTQCGCKIFSTKVIDVFEDQFISSWLFDIEIILRIRNNYDSNGEFIVQVPLEKLNDVEKKINYDLVDILRLTIHLFKIQRCYN